MFILTYAQGKIQKISTEQKVEMNECGIIIACKTLPRVTEYQTRSYTRQFYYLVPMSLYHAYVPNQKSEAINCLSVQ